MLEYLLGVYVYTIVSGLFCSCAGSIPKEFLLLALVMFCLVYYHEYILWLLGGSVLHS